MRTDCSVGLVGDLGLNEIIPGGEMGEEREVGAGLAKKESLLHSTLVGIHIASIGAYAYDVAFRWACEVDVQGDVLPR